MPCVWTSGVLYCSLNFLRIVAMSLKADQFMLLMNAITATKDDIEGNFTARLDKFQCDVQTSTSLEVLAKISKKAYHFKRKGNEVQFNLL